jgi:hypothetical protein
VGTVDVPAGLARCGSLTGAVAFEDYGAVEDIAAEGKVEVLAGVGFETEGFHGGELVDGGED